MLASVLKWDEDVTWELSHYDSLHGPHHPSIHERYQELHEHLPCTGCAFPMFWHLNQAFVARLWLFAGLLFNTSFVIQTKRARTDKQAWIDWHVDQLASLTRWWNESQPSGLLSNALASDCSDRPQNSVIQWLTGCTTSRSINWLRNSFRCSSLKFPQSFIDLLIDRLIRRMTENLIDLFEKVLFVCSSVKEPTAYIQSWSFG